MKLSLSVNESADALINYFKNFSITSTTKSLPFEIDTKTNYFVAKATSELGDRVRYSALSFAECNVKVLEDEGNGEHRVRVGINNKLDKFIKVMETVASTMEDIPEDQPKAFNIVVYFDAFVDRKETSYICTGISFESPSISIKYETDKATGFDFIPDSVFFNKAIKLKDPVSFMLTPDRIKKIINVSDIVKVGGNDDILAFHLNGNEVWVYSDENPDASLFKLKLGNLLNDAVYNQIIAVRRRAFIDSLDKTNESFICSTGITVIDVPAATENEAPRTDEIVDRFVLKSETTDTIVILAKLMDE